MSDLQGNPALVLVRTEFGFDKQSGDFMQKVWEGTEAACAGGVATIGNADSYLRSPVNGGKWQLTARYGSHTDEGGTEEPTTEERLRFNQVQRSIFDAPEFASVGIETKRYIESNVGEDDAGGTLRDHVVEANDPEALALWDLVSSGVKEKVIYQPVIIVTDTASSSYAWNIGFVNIGKIFRTAGMINDADLEAGWASNLPDDADPNASYAYGWLKSPPEIVNAGNNRSQLVQEYTYNLWSLLLYELA